MDTSSILAVEGFKSMSRLDSSPYPAARHWLGEFVDVGYSMGLKIKGFSRNLDLSQV